MGNLQVTRSDSAPVDDKLMEVLNTVFLFGHEKLPPGRRR
jgi:hypothetical protein